LPYLNALKSDKAPTAPASSSPPPVLTMLSAFYQLSTANSSSPLPQSPSTATQMRSSTFYPQKLTAPLLCSALMKSPT
jgi:hypothetical protein